MENLRKFFIGGEWVAPATEAVMPVLNPATEAQIGTLAMGCAEDVNRAAAAANAAFESYGHSTKVDRLSLLHSLKVATQERLEDLTQAMRMEMGTPITMPREVQADAALGHLADAVICGRLLFSRVFLSDVDQSRLRSFVRPLCAAHLTAGLDEVRMPGPYQTIEL